MDEKQLQEIEARAQKILRYILTAERTDYDFNMDTQYTVKADADLHQLAHRDIFTLIEALRASEARAQAAEARTYTLALLIQCPQCEFEHEFMWVGVLPAPEGVTQI